MPIDRALLTVPDANTDADITFAQGVTNAINDLKTDAADRDDGIFNAADLTLKNNAGSGDAGDRHIYMNITDTSKAIIRWSNSLGRFRFVDQTFNRVPVQVGDPTSSFDAATKDYVDNALCFGFRGSAPPVYLSATQFSMASIVERNSTDDGNIIKKTTTTADITTTGSNGIGQSANLAGTVSTSGSPSTTITGTGTAFTTDFVVGDVIESGGNARRITAIASNTSLTVESNITIVPLSTYKRGGRAPNCWYLVYALSSGNLFLSPRNVAGGQALVDLPVGVTKFRQLPFAVRLDASRNIIKFKVSSGWPDRPWIRYDDLDFIYNAADVTRVLNNSNDTNFTDVPCNAVVPPISRLIRALVWAGASTSAGADSVIFTREKGSSSAGVRIAHYNNNGAGQEREIPVNASQIFEYKTGGSTQYATISVSQWLAEVP